MLDPQTRLRKAVIEGNLPIVQRLLSRFPNLWLNVDPKNQGWCNLHYASYYGYYLVCFHLISFINNDLQNKYTTLDLLSFDNLSVLHVCVKGKHLQTLHYLLQEFPGKLWLNYPGGEDKQTPLHWSCKYGFNEGTKLLLEFGANWDDRDGNGDTCLHHCFQHGNLQCMLEILKYIFQQSSDKEEAIEKINYIEHMRNKRGCVAFDYAASGNMARKYQLLKQELMSMDYSDSGEPSTNSSEVYTLKSQSTHSLEVNRVLASPILPISEQKQEDITETNIKGRPHSQSLPPNLLPAISTKVRSRSNTNYIYQPPSLNTIAITSPRFSSQQTFSPTTPTNRAPSIKSVTISPSIRSNITEERPTSPQSICSIQSSITTSPIKPPNNRRRSFSFSKVVSINEHDQYPSVESEITLQEGTNLRPRAESTSAVAVASTSASTSYLAAKKAFASRVGTTTTTTTTTPSQRSRQSTTSQLEKSNSITSSVSIGSMGSPRKPLRKTQSTATLTGDAVAIPQRTDSTGSLISPPLESMRKFSVNSISFSRIR